MLVVMVTCTDMKLRSVSITRYGGRKQWSLIINMFRCYYTGYTCVCINARSIVNKRNELNIMVEDIKDIKLNLGPPPIYQMPNLE